MISNPNTWNTTQSDANAIIFRANDFLDPESSKIFNKLFSFPQISEKVKNFAIICKTSFDKITSLSDFIANKNIPQLVIASNKTKTSIVQYLSAYQVLNAKEYSTCLKYVGDKVELIGQIYEVKQATRHGKHYIANPKKNSNTFTFQSESGFLQPLNVVCISNIPSID